MPIKANSCSLWIHILSKALYSSGEGIYIILLGRVVSSNISITHQDFTSKSQLTLHGVIRYSLSVAPGIYGLKCYFVTPCYLNKNRGHQELPIPKTTLRLLFESVQNGMRRASEIAMYIKIQIYMLITHFLISNIITIFFVLIIYITSVSKKP